MLWFRTIWRWERIISVPLSETPLAVTAWRCGYRPEEINRIVAFCGGVVGKEAVIAAFLQDPVFMRAVPVKIAISIPLAIRSGFAGLLSLFRSLSQGKRRNRYRPSADIFVITAQHLHFFSKQFLDIRCWCSKEFFKKKPHDLKGRSGFFFEK